MKNYYPSKYLKLPFKNKMLDATQPHQEFNKLKNQHFELEIINLGDYLRRIAKSFENQPQKFDDLRESVLIFKQSLIKKIQKN
jgi:hypothetical protein